MEDIPAVRYSDWISELMIEQKEHDRHLTSQMRCAFCNCWTHCMDETEEPICHPEEGCSVLHRCVLDKKVKVDRFRGMMFGKKKIPIKDHRHPVHRLFMKLVKQFAKDHNGVYPTFSETKKLCFPEIDGDTAQYIYCLRVRSLRKAVIK